jgi:hypothetical protein
MTRIAVLCYVLAILASSVPSLARAAVTVSPSRTEVSTSIGRDFTFSTRLDNKAFHGDAAARGAPERPLACARVSMSIRRTCRRAARSSSARFRLGAHA